MDWVALRGAELSSSLLAAGGLVAAVEFENTVTLGAAIIALCTGLAALIGIFYGVRYKTSFHAAEAAAGAWKEGAEAQAARADRLEADLAEALLLIGEQKEAIARLEALPNLTKLVEFMAESTKQADAAAGERVRRAIATVEDILASAAEEHERNARKRNEALLAELRALKPSTRKEK